ncbi:MULTISPECIES: SCO family protein [Pseudomonadaceae]|uniref:Sco1/SenC family protein n=1 Tax=Pseudomonas saudiphocaensis TaxID=1499686 RepID=A0A078LRS8_9PSED|nr:MULTISPECIES: SCO family protein [Pseudomonadaceae]MCF6783549.1 SCO family protein [Stutzerimonas stutzeri]MCF6806446.1 SCO family protein [Stutzerimonas stutzeri]RRV13590.1 SCO family protein [Pseudomonas saudiphocaensis]CDZ95188.1 Sco1/SenC family protein [Pseudomonas saudiphocaensis]
MSRIQTTVFILVALIALVVGLTVYRVLDREPPADPTRMLDAGIILLPQSRPVPVLSLTDQDGEAVQTDELQGKWTLLFFGYTFCPDICPATLAELRQLRSGLPEAVRERLQPVLVSVDPHRDTPEQLGKYLKFFGEGFIGLTGSLDDIQALANGVGIPFIPGDTSRENYTVDHSGNLVIIGPDGRQRGFIRAPLKVDKLREQLPALLSQTE